MIVWGVLYVLSFLLVMVMNDWLMVWLGLEINMLSFILVIYDVEEYLSLESCYKYFFIQSMSSGLLLISIFMGLGVSLVLSMKVGISVFYFWYPGVVKGLKWSSNIFLMIFQKMIPMFLMTGDKMKILLMISLTSMMVGWLGSFNQTDLKFLMAYSSINQLGWVVLMMVTQGEKWVVYLGFYSMIMMVLLKWMGDSNLLMVSDMMMKSKSMVFYMVLGMMGFPPFVGFMMKILVLKELMILSILLGSIALLFSLGMMYVYIRLFFMIMISMGDSMIYMKFKSNYNFLIMELVMIMGFLFFAFF
uniref:NADH-ubiquinone oxidoreductase chain 2 n=1 Tax=Atypus karschi TaxID=2337319 RepID=A0A8A5YAM3_9ARAC|nr:NADH dehydrogenase subunit 2 [Atypus karschi]QTH31094.1 NADH dehydrogenase subunit 2 [Atypus karschi]